MHLDLSLLYIHGAPHGVCVVFIFHLAREKLPRRFKQLLGHSDCLRVPYHERRTRLHWIHSHVGYCIVGDRTSLIVGLCQVAFSYRVFGILNPHPILFIFLNKTVLLVKRLEPAELFTHRRISRVFDPVHLKFNHVFFTCNGSFE